MTPDIPEAYIGQPRRHEPDPFVTDSDVSNPLKPGSDRTPMDSVDLEKPSGAQETGSPTGRKVIRVRWYRGHG